MDSQHGTTGTVITNEWLDTLDAASSTEEALRLVDACRARIAPGSIFSIQRNVTTARDAHDQILLRRFHSSAASTFPVEGTKRKTRTAWTECLFVQGRVFVGEGEQVLAQNFDDFAQMRAFALRSVVNVPLLQGRQCFATFNVFGTRERWLPDELLAIRLLALATARWVPPMPGLDYRFTPAQEGIAEAMAPASHD